MKHPQFIVAGAARAGTSSLNSYLMQHPDIFLPKVKEPCFFSFAGEKINFKNGKFAFAINSIDQYCSLFKKANSNQITGDISTPYLYLYEKTIDNFRKFHDNFQNVKIIIILRDPVERAYSQYLWRVRDGREELTFEQAIAAEKNRIMENYSFDYFYLDRGLYYKQVKAYLDNFTEVKIILFEEFKNNTEHILKEICYFLGVDPNFKFIKKTNQNASFLPKSIFVSRLISTESKTKFRLLKLLPNHFRSTIKEKLMLWNKSKNELAVMNLETEKLLRNYFREDLLMLQKLINRDLSHWIQKEF